MKNANLNMNVGSFVLLTNIPTQYSSKSILGCVQRRIKDTFSSSKF